MKRLGMIGSVLVCMLAAVIMIVPVSAATTYIRGDADGNGHVSITDVTMIQRELAQLETDITGWVKRRGNVTGGSFDITDATAIQRYLAEFDEPYQIGKKVIYEPYELPLVKAMISECKTEVVCINDFLYL